MKIKLFTHNDLDGVGCAVLAKIAFKDNLDTEICSYNDINEKVSNFFKNCNIDDYAHIYITDISVSEETANLIDKINKDFNGNINLIDHHKTAELLNKYPWAYVVVEESCVLQSGTSLFYDELIACNFIKCNKCLDSFVDNVRLYDTWEWKRLGEQTPKDLNDVFNILGIDDFTKDMISNLNYDLNKLSDFSIGYDNMRLLKYKRKEIDIYISKKLDNITYLDHEGYKAGIVLCDRYDCLSELGNEMCKDKDVEIAILVYDGGIALRSIGDIDVSQIAKKYGGGGHKNAAGYKQDIDFYSLVF